MTVTITPSIGQVCREPLRFGRDEAQRAADAWGFNCGPGALCAVLGSTPDLIRPRLGTFEAKGYTNPQLMFAILRNLGVEWRRLPGGRLPNGEPRWPCQGLVRVQWGGPWTAPGRPPQARYRHTHWIAYRDCVDFADVFDVNATCCGGWLSFEEWNAQLVPWLLREVQPKADGTWWETHVLKLSGPAVESVRPPSEEN